VTINVTAVALFGPFSALAPALLGVLLSAIYGIPAVWDNPVLLARKLLVKECLVRSVGLNIHPSQQH